MNLFVPNIKQQASFEGVGYLNSSAVAKGRIERLLAAIIAAEFFVVTGTSFLTSVAYYVVILTGWPPTVEYVTAAILIAVLVLLTALGFKQYVAIQAQSRDRYMWSGLGAVALAFSLFLSLLFVFKIADWYSRGTFFCQFVSVTAAMLIARGTMYSYVRRAIESGTVEARRAILVGDTKDNPNILEKLEQSGIHCLDVIRFPSGHGNMVAGIEASSTSIRTFIERCRGLRLDDILFLAASTDLPRIARLVDVLSELPVAVHIIPTGADELWGSAKVTNFGGTVTIQVLHPPLSFFDLAIKRSFDFCAAGLGLLLLSPLLLVVSIAIKLGTYGPVFFRQNRHGYNNQVIPVLKFRTMTVIEDGETVATFTQARANDPRVTRLGRILRRTNIDELPQLLNVLRGEMSIVGPRPHPLALNSTFQERIAPFSRRHNVKPGLTGWAQVNGFRGETNTIEKMQRRVEYDLHYIDNWSFMLDLKIVLMTLFSKSVYRNAC
jgi:Undecaprenyl-phosphate glucose phosphotransferase